MLSEKQRGQLQESINLTRETPRTAVAESRFKRLVRKSGSDANDGMPSVLVEMLSDTLKKSSFRT